MEQSITGSRNKCKVKTKTNYIIAVEYSINSSSSVESFSLKGSQLEHRIPWDISQVFWRDNRIKKWNIYSMFTIPANNSSNKQVD